MKRVLTIILCSLTCALSIAASAHAQSAGTEICDPSSQANQILPCTSVADRNGKEQQLPTADLKYQILPQSIKIVLAVAGSASIAVFVYAGIMLVISQGNEEALTKFKDVLIYSIIGLLLVTVSYGLVRGIMQLVFR